MESVPQASASEPSVVQPPPKPMQSISIRASRFPLYWKRAVILLLFAAGIVFAPIPKVLLKDLQCSPCLKLDQATECFQCLRKGQIYWKPSLYEMITGRSSKPDWLTSVISPAPTLPPVAPASPDPTANWEIFNSKLGYSIRYPNNLQYKKYETKALHLFLVEPFEEHDIAFSIDEAEPKTLEEIKNEWLAHYNDVKFQGIPNISVDAFIASGKAKAGFVPGLIQRNAFIKLNQQTIVFDCGTYTKCQDELLDQILSTFTILDTKSNGGYSCPQTEWVDCMPGPGATKPECGLEYLTWANQNCPNFKGVAY